MIHIKKLRPLHQWIASLLFVVLFGIAGFMMIEDYNLLDAFYMVMVTITTIGYHEIKPLSNQGKIFNVIFILTSFSTFTFVLAKLTQYIVSGEMAHYFTKKRLMHDLKKMHDHVVICGFGRNGQQAAKTLKAHKIDFIVIEKHADALNHYLEEDPSLVYYIGDATEDDILVKAGVQKARAILITLPEDADNVFIVLSARFLSPHLQIVSRASSPGATAKLYKAGASNVIMPDMIGGAHMATLVSKPDVIEFVDFLSGEDGEAIHIEAISYNNLPSFIRDKSLKDIMDWKKTGVNCIGIKDINGKFVINPPDSIVISNGMKVIVLGTRDQITQMKKNVGE